MLFMKKAVSIIATVTLVAGSLAPVLALAQPRTGCTLRHDIQGFLTEEEYPELETPCEKGEPIDQANAPGYWGVCCILDSVYTVTDWVFWGLMVIASFLVVMGGIKIATAGGAKEKIDQGRDMIMYAMVGLAVALLARAVPAMVQAII